MQVRIESIHFTADKKLRDYIELKLKKLEQIYGRIIDVHVILKLENSGRVKDKVTEIKISVPGDLLVTKQVSKTFEAGVDLALDVLKRQLVKYKEKVRSY